MMQIVELWRYPVKSMRGEQLQTATISELGIAGDRAWGIVDVETGKTLTGRREPRLLMAASRLDGSEIVITLPDGTETADNSTLSAWLERDVSLTAASAGLAGSYEIQLDFETEVGEWIGWEGPDGSFHDSTKTRVSLVSQQTMRSWDQGRFRMNVITDGSDEEALVGGEVQVGDGGAVLTVLKEVDRCIMVTRPQPGLDRDLDVLKAINAERGGNLGIGANVVSGGSVSVSDTITRR